MGKLKIFLHLLKSQLIMFWFVFLSTIEVGLTLDNGVAITPPMGWMWDAFFCKKQCEGRSDAEDCISDLLIRRKADQLKANGVVDAGYKFILIKSCWMAETRTRRRWQIGALKW